MPSTLSNHRLKSSFAFEAIGTHWVIESPEPVADKLKRAVAERIETFDQTYSRFREDSLVASLALRAGTYKFPDDSAALMEYYRVLYDVTHGKLTPLVGRAMEEIGYDKDYSLRVGKAHKVPAWDDAMEWKGSSVTTKRAVVLDIGAAGKGYLVDIIGELLEAHGVGEYVIDAGGDMRHRGDDIQRIGLENPYDPTRVIGIMNMQNASLCASAINRRQWGGGMHHVFDPTSLSPTREVVATWVAAETTMLADGLATALFFTDGTSLQKNWDFQYVRLMADGKISHSHEFMGELFI